MPKKERKNLMKKLVATVSKIKSLLSEGVERYEPAYRVVSIEQDNEGDYVVVIQIIGKAITYKARPEKLLADDKMVNLFSPTDIRNLTYLGYLGINSPKYRILAKQLSEDQDEMLFAVHKKGEKDSSVFTAREISSNEEILSSLSQEDAHMVGFTTASEQEALEKKQKAELLKQLKKDK